jgi:type I restriction enzyme S subunit
VTVTGTRTVGWTDVPLGELIVEAKPGFASGERDDEGVLQVRMHNVDTEGILDFSKATRVPATPKQIAECRLQPGDVLFNNTNSAELVGKTSVFLGYDEPVVYSNHFTRFRVDRDRLEPRYLARWLTYQQRRGVFERLCTRWVNQSAVRAEAVFKLRIATPCVGEQQRIADILDKADVIRRKRREAESIAAGLRAAAFLATFGSRHSGWGEHSLSDLADVQGGVALSGRRGSFARKVPYLRVANVFRDRLNLTEIKVVGVTDDEFDKTRLRKGDVLIVEGHGNREEIGRSAIWDGTIPECVHQNHLIRARPSPDKLYPVFLNAFVNSEVGRRQLFRFGKTTSGLNTISLSNVRSMRILLPPIRLQEQYAEFVRGQTELMTRLGEATGASEEMFGSLVQRAFLGEL